MATTSKEGSRRVNYPILTQGGSGVFSYFTTPLVVYCEKIRVFKAGVCLNRLAWNND